MSERCRRCRPGRAGDCRAFAFCPSAVAHVERTRRLARLRGARWCSGHHVASTAVGQRRWGRSLPEARVRCSRCSHCHHFHDVPELSNEEVSAGGPAPLLSCGCAQRQRADWAQRAASASPPGRADDFGSEMSLAPNVGQSWHRHGASTAADCDADRSANQRTRRASPHRLDRARCRPPSHTPSVPR